MAVLNPSARDRAAFMLIHVYCTTSAISLLRTEGGIPSTRTPREYQQRRTHSKGRVPSAPSIALGLAPPLSVRHAPLPSTQAETDADADSTQSTTVEFADANLERAVREALDRPQGPLTPEDLAALTELDASYKNIESVAGLEHATALHTLYLRDNAITDVSPLANLTNLHTLSLWENAIADV